MASKLPNIIWEQPSEKAKKQAIKYIHEYNMYLIRRVLEDMPPHHRQQAYETIIDDLENNDAKEYGEFFI